jgi:ribosomal-protein-serine acetyltransferase
LDEEEMCLCKTGDGIELRAIRNADIEKLLELAIWSEELWPLKSFRQRLTEAAELHARGKGLACALYVEGEAAGYVIMDFHWTKSGQLHHGQLHYGLAPSHRGKGVVTKSCGALIDYAFRRLDLESVSIIVPVLNSESCGVPERLGFEKAGTSWGLDEDGQPVETAEYAMSRGGWQAREPR